MIKISNLEVFGWAAAIRGMRNPLNSHHLSDSDYLDDSMHTDEDFRIGNRDLQLMKTLAAAGSDHRKYLRMLTIYVDITAPLFWWKEFDTYKVGTVANSESTMHTIHKKEFTLDMFSIETIKNNSTGAAIFFKNITYQLNALRNAYLETKDKDYWRMIIEMLPSSFNQKRTISMNYEVLLNMYHSRKNHKLQEWRDFCTYMMRNLPLIEELI